MKNKNIQRVHPKDIKKTGRRLKTLSPIEVLVPFIMKTRNASNNMISMSLNTEAVDKYIKEKRAQGMPNLSFMHVFIAAYVRTVAKMPGINRYVQGQRVYARNNIEVCLTIKKEMRLDSPDTVVKLFFYPDATIKDVYDELERAIVEYRNDNDGGLGSTVNFLIAIPALILKFIMWVLNCLDYFNLLPRFLTRLSPFHGSMYITSMGSLRIPAIVHHLYDFGNVPMFIAFGAKYHKNEIKDDGTVVRRSYVDYTINMDERICDGYYYASALKYTRSLFHNPYVLDQKPEQVTEDIK